MDGPIVARCLGDKAVVPFEARRLAAARVVLLNQDLLAANDDEVLERFAWAVPGSGDPAAMFASRSRTLFAERYGGEGLGFHGGGVRVGSDGAYQIKGIGRNPLAGEGSLPDYAHGGMSLFEGIQEAIWGEIFHHALPFGAVRSPAVLATSSPCWWVIDRWGVELLRGRYGDDAYLPRGLLVREAALRPAHFERAMMHRPPAHVARALPPDPARVRAAVRALPDLLPLPDREAERLAPAERLELGALEMARRFAEQGAAAKSKRLIHGNISPSNLCLDGRWIDFGSVTALPGWGDVGGYGPFWDDSEPYVNIFTTVCFNLGKYLPPGEARLPRRDALIDEYTRVHARSLERRFVALTGVPFELLEGEEGRAERSQLWRTLHLIATSGHGAPFEGHPDDDSAFGRYRLGSALVAAARWWDTPDCDRRLRPHLSSAELRSRLLAAYGPVLEAARRVAAGRGVSPPALRRLCVINAAKGAKAIRLLYRAHMVKHTEAMVLAHRDFDQLRRHAEAWLRDLSDQASVVYEDPAGLTTTLWRRGADVVRYDARRDAFVVGGERGESVHPVGAVDAARPGVPALAGAFEYWGADMAEAFT
jgi:hypothetical protein